MKVREKQSYRGRGTELGRPGVLSLEILTCWTPALGWALVSEGRCKELALWFKFKLWPGSEPSDTLSAGVFSWLTSQTEPCTDSSSQVAGLSLGNPSGSWRVSPRTPGKELLSTRILRWIDVSQGSSIIYTLSPFIYGNIKLLELARPMMIT